MIRPLITITANIGNSRHEYTLDLCGEITNEAFDREAVAFLNSLQQRYGNVAEPRKVFAAAMEMTTGTAERPGQEAAKE